MTTQTTTQTADEMSSFGLVFKSRYPYRTLHHVSCPSFGKATKWNKNVVKLAKLTDYDADLADCCSKCLASGTVAYSELATQRRQSFDIAEAAKAARLADDAFVAQGATARSLAQVQSNVGNLQHLLLSNAPFTSKSSVASRLEEIAADLERIALQVRQS